MFFSSYKYALSCFFGGSGCDYIPGLRGSVFITMYTISYIGGGLLLRYAEGATYLAVVNVSIVAMDNTMHHTVSMVHMGEAWHGTLTCQVV